MFNRAVLNNIDHSLGRRAQPIMEITGVGPHQLTDAILESTEPLILRGLVSGWPAVQAGLASENGADNYLRRYGRDADVVAMLGAPDIGGRFFYNDDLSGFNFFPMRAKLGRILNQLASARHDLKPPAIYIGATSVDACLPGFREHNDLSLGARDAAMSVWIGNSTRIAAHYDVPDNLACVVAGRRRFTLFPPEQLDNLYIGPLDFTPAGQPVSLVDFKRPDFDRFPKFADALKQSRIAELGPGDAILIPSMWWHQVEALDRFNVLVNYWWRQSPAYLASPNSALMLALISMRDLPHAQRMAWQEMFRHYVFEADQDTSSHIDDAARRVLGTLDEDAVEALRARLLKQIKA